MPTMALHVRQHSPAGAVHLILRPGHCLALMGPNGAGKSSLCRLLAGLPTQRHVHASQLGAVSLDVVIDGQHHAWLQMSRRKRARYLAWLPQHHEVAGQLRVQDVVALGRLPWQSWFQPGMPSGAVDEALHVFDLSSMRNRLVSSLSGGERQRVQLARVWASDAPLLVLDEPWDSLDPVYQERLWQLIQARCQAGAAILCVTHDPALAVRADELVAMRADGMLCSPLPTASLTAASLERYLEAVFGTSPAIRRDLCEGELSSWWFSRDRSTAVSSSAQSARD